MNSKINLLVDFLIRDKLLEVADQQTSLSNSASSAADFDENLFQQFMLKNLVWDFNGISRDDYLRKSKADKEQLLLNYYNQMKMGEQITFNIFYCLLRCLLRCLFAFLNCCSLNLPSTLNGADSEILR